MDSAGNSPLHYAAKYGHYELCKLLVEKGSYAGKRNSMGQTPYDVSDNHSVRQFLLPLQFKDEREQSSGMGGYTGTSDVTSMNQQYTSYSSIPTNNIQSQYMMSQPPAAVMTNSPYHQPPSEAVVAPSAIGVHGNNTSSRSNSLTQSGPLMSAIPVGNQGLMPQAQPAMNLGITNPSSSFSIPPTDVSVAPPPPIMYTNNTDPATTVLNPPPLMPMTSASYSKPSPTNSRIIQPGNCISFLSLQFS